MKRAALGFVAAPVVLGACGDGVERSERSVCGEVVEVVVDGDVVSVEGAQPGDWRLTWFPEDGGDLTATIGPLPLRTTDTEDGLARITVPDASCTALAGGDPASTRVLGDSLAFQVATFGGPAWQGTPGAAYALVTDDPTSSALDEVRGAVADGPRVLVLEYGANDALWIGGADDPEPRRAAVAAAIDTVLAATAGVPCLRVVTPSVGPTEIFGQFEVYAAEAERVAAMLRERAPDGSIVDWTAASAGHHLPDGTDGDWFPDGDEIHPNEEGRDALVDLVEEAVESC